MGFSSCSSWECACTHTMADGYGLIHYERCPKHYVPEVDDPKILKAASNKRKMDEAWRALDMASQAQAK